MNCKKAQRLLTELADDRLSPPVASAVRQHLADCTDCRVQQQRAVRLQQLLTIKRYEQPPAAYFEGFLDEFHQRLAEESAPSLPGWQRALDAFAQRLGLEPCPTCRYTLASAVGAMALLTVAWFGIFQTASQSENADSFIASVVSPALPSDMDDTMPASTPRKIAGTLPAPARAAATPPMLPAALMSVPAAMRHHGDSPRYILDRISVMPASYEVADNIRF
jgi:anti-sigma factor RsiW